MGELKIKVLRWPHAKSAGRRFQGHLKGESMVRNKRSYWVSRVSWRRGAVLVAGMWFDWSQKEASK